MAEKVTHRHMIEQWKQYPVDQTGYVSDESAYSNKSIVRDLLDIRADEIRNALAGKVSLSEFMVQSLPCVEVVEVDRAECACAPASGCYWLKSKVPIPVFIQMISVTGIVANSENPRFSFIKWDRFQYIPESRSVSMAKGNYWTIRETSEGAYLYLYGNRFLKRVTISAIWEDPISVEAFPNCGEINKDVICNPLEVDFYTDAWLRKLIIAKSWQTILAAKSVAPRDSLNDDTVGNNPLNTKN